jgi:radical SAM protein with 4Fe4S-binding SPASM domain
MAGMLVKTLNLFRACSSYLRNTVTGQPVASGMPPAIGIELTNHCNLRCPECATGSGMITRPVGFMDPGLYEKVISELKPYLFYVSLYFQGEPMMHPSLGSFLRLSGKIRTIISTNGHFLSRENSRILAEGRLHKLIISVDGTDQETYSAYRLNGNLETVLEGIRNISEVRNKYGFPKKLEIQMLVNRFNESQTGAMKNFASSIHARLRMKSMQIISDSNHMKWLPEQSRFRRYELKAGLFRLKRGTARGCARLWLNPVITWDGKVLPCCFDKDAEHIMGDMTQESFRDIWNGSKYRLFRRLLHSERSAIGICQNCTVGLKGVNT